MYNKKTDGIDIIVEPMFLEDQSSPSEDHYVWAYHIRITNESAKPVQLRHRHWQITDAMGRQQEVHGEGVVGKQPVLKPGESFEYTSGTPLTTPSGIMVGRYQMESERGQLFDVAIPAFSLDSPHQAIRLH
jgi:ApaG protein